MCIRDSLLAAVVLAGRICAVVVPLIVVHVIFPFRHALFLLFQPLPVEAPGRLRPVGNVVGYYVCYCTGAICWFCVEQVNPYRVLDDAIVKKRFELTITFSSQIAPFSRRIFFLTYLYPIAWSITVQICAAPIFPAPYGSAAAINRSCPGWVDPIFENPVNYLRQTLAYLAAIW